MKKHQLTLLALALAAAVTVGCGDSHSVPTFNQVAFISNRTVSPATPLFRMNLDGSSVVAVASTVTNAYSPSISADLKTMAFTSSENIWVGNSDGTNQTQLTTDGDTYYAKLSPNGKKIAFGHYDGTEWQFWIMNPDGTGALNLTPTLPEGMTYGCFTGSFSADSSKVVFACYGPSAASGAYIVKADGTNTTTVTTQAGFIDTPVFSPDGKQILFVVYPSTSAQHRPSLERARFPHSHSAPEVSGQGIASANLDGSNVTLLVPNAYEAEILNSILYYTIWNSDLELSQIYKAKLDGTGAVSLSDGTADDRLGLSGD